jgi:hypothetical protein
MTTKITLWGEHGRIHADRQEIQVYLRDTAEIPEGYRAGWNVRYTTDLTEAPWFYLRGEEYSAQLDAFVWRVRSRAVHGQNDFGSAAATDRVIAMISEDATRVDARLAASGHTATITPLAPRRASRFGTALRALRGGAR